MVIFSKKQRGKTSYKARRQKKIGGGIVNLIEFK